MLWRLLTGIQALALGMPSPAAAQAGIKPQ